MALDGVFLDSRVGRRIVLMFVLAAAVPIGVLGVLAHSGWTAYAQAQEQQRLAQATKAAGLRVFDRLLAARAVLRDLASASAASRMLSGSADDGERVFHAIAIDGADTLMRTAAPDELRLLDWWRSQRAPSNQQLFVVPDRDAPRVVLAVRDAAAQVIVVGEVEPGFLWSDTFASGEAAQACVFGPGDLPIHCSQAPRPPTASAGEPPTRTARWGLFLRREFGAEDWTFRTEQGIDPLTEEAVPVARLAWQVVLASMLIVAVLSLVLVRRTMVPLQRLTEATRRLAQGDFAARVPVGGRDEFGELGASFNDMAVRIGEQVEEMSLLASIDRDILESADADLLLARVLARLAELAPQACVGVARVDSAAARVLRCHVRRPDGAPAVQPVVLTPAQWQWLLARRSGWVDAEGGLHGIAPLRDGDAAYLAPARWHDELLGVLYVALPGGVARGVAWCAQVDGLRDRVAVGLASALRERQLVHRALHDSLTGLLNRAGLQDALERAIAGARAERRRFAVLFIDLDRFKSVNDTMGHVAGDELLRIAATRVTESLPAGATLTRPGGDEFVAVLPDAAIERLDDIAGAVCRRLAESFPLRGHEVTLGASVGVALYPDDGALADDLLRHADMAMYAAKGRGRGRSARFDAALDAAAMQYAQVLRDLRQAVPRGELMLQYQPRVDAASGRTRSVEALVRWNHPQRGLLPPGAFIEVAEETGLIAEIGRWVLHEACRQLAAWRRDGVRLSHVAVNVSVGQLRSAELCGDVAAALRAHGLAPTDLELEVTESVMVGDPRAASDLLRRIAATGVRIALDDFGTGYSSMSYLRHMPIDIIKVDRAFVRDLGIEPSAEAVTRAIVALASSLGMSLVAEGVETQAQATLLQAMGCQELQGYLYSRPVDAARLCALACIDFDASRSDVEVLAQ